MNVVYMWCFDPTGKTKNDKVYATVELGDGSGYGIWGGRGKALKHKRYSAYDLRAKRDDKLRKYRTIDGKSGMERDIMATIDQYVTDVIGIALSSEGMEPVRETRMAICLDNEGFEEQFQVGVDYVLLAEKPMRHAMVVENMLGQPVEVSDLCFAVS
jgi:hypothetical protein